MRIGYADPPYPGMAHLYREHPDYAGEVDHAELIARLEADYDGWVLHTASTTLTVLVPLLPDGARIGAWVKPFAAFKPNVSPAYAWEPVIFKPARKAGTGGLAGPTRDWVAERITMQRGLTGAKPEAVCWWAFEILGAHPDDELHDMYPGSGAVSRAWDTWRATLRLPLYGGAA